MTQANARPELFMTEEALRLSGLRRRWKRKPKSGCKACHGRGHTGFDVDRLQYVQCHCTR